MRLTRWQTIVLGITLSLTSASLAQAPKRKAPAKAKRAAVASRPGARWLGQDEHDVAGPSPVLAPSEVQDIHIAIHGLPANKKITTATLEGFGGSLWMYNGPYGSWKADIERKEGATTADLYAEPDRNETGRPFTLSLTFDDGTKLNLNLNGGKADPNLRMPGKALQARWKGQPKADHVGPGPSVGPDGLQDAVIALKNISPDIEVKSIAIDGKGLPGWRYGVNPELKGNAELVRSPGEPSNAELAFQPTSRGKRYRSTSSTPTARPIGRPSRQAHSGHQSPCRR